jgi:uncharacterized membrane protein YbaN (DUF454 family)
MNYQAPDTPHRKPSHPLWRMTKIIIGFGFLGLGVIGLFLPILQGVLFMIVGLAILSTENRRVRALVEEIKRRHPGPWRRAHALKHRLSVWFKAKVKRGEDKPSDEGASGPTS